MGHCAASFYRRLHKAQPAEVGDMSDADHGHRARGSRLALAWAGLTLVAGTTGLLSGGSRLPAAGGDGADTDRGARQILAVLGH